MKDVNDNSREFAELVAHFIKGGYSYKSDISEMDLQRIVRLGKAESFMSNGLLKLHFLRCNRSYGVLRYGDPLITAGCWCVFAEEIHATI